MTRKKKILIGASIAALTVTGALAVGASAHDRYRDGFVRHYGAPMMRGHERFGEGASQMFDRFDTNKDGKVTQAEIDAVRAKDLAKYDTNHDGELEIGEYKNLWLDLMNRRMVRSFQRLDVNGDGKVTADEMKAPMTRIARFLDRNGDGSITRDELHPRWHGDDRGPRRDMDHGPRRDKDGGDRD